MDQDAIDRITTLENSVRIVDILLSRMEQLEERIKRLEEALDG